jgi:hypothetical protein
LLTNSSGVHILLHPHQNEFDTSAFHEALNSGASPTPDFSCSRTKYAHFFSQIIFSPHPHTYLTELIHPRLSPPGNSDPAQHSTHMPLPCQAQYRPHMNHTQESPGILQQPQLTIFFCNTPHPKK